MKNKTTWVLLFLILFCFTCLFGVAIYAMLPDDMGWGRKVALIEVTGPIDSSRDIVRQFKKYRRDNSVKAVVLRIESPGGGISASQEIYDIVRKTREEGKPVIASLGSVAASGGYYIACAADSIVANPGSITGSIGVIVQYPNIDKLLEKVGISMITVKTGKYKDIMSPFRSATKDEMSFLNDFVLNAYDQFLEVVVRERNLDPAKVRELADGRVYTGEQARALNLVDVLGSYEDAIILAGRMAGIDGYPNLKIQDRRKPGFFESLFETRVFSDAIHGLSDFKSYPVALYQYSF